MFEEGIFVDFALAAADGRYLKVHRVLLCTFSQFFEVTNCLTTPTVSWKQYQYVIASFKDLLDKRPENFDFVRLKDVSWDDLKALVEVNLGCKVLY